MTPFTDVLQQIDRRLAVPQPARSRILLEVAADLDDLYAAYLAEGLSADQARDRSIDHCDLSDAALAELTRVHTHGLRRWLDGLGHRTVSLWERVFFVLVVAFLVLFTGRFLFAEGFAATAGGLVWVVAIVSLAAISLALSRLYILYVKQDHRPRGLRRGTTTVLALAVANVIIGAVGFWLRLQVTAERITQDTEQALPLLVDWLLGGSALLIAAYMGAIIAGVLWLILNGKTAEIEQAEAAMLLSN